MAADSYMGKKTIIRMLQCLLWILLAVFVALY